MTSPSMMNNTWAVIVAAGRGERLGAGVPKAFVQVKGRTLLDYAAANIRAAGITNIITVVSADMTDHDLPGQVVIGGAERADSVRAGLKAIPDADGIVLVHDCARAFAPPEMIRRVQRAVAEGNRAVVPVVAVTDTIKRVADGVVVDTPPRDELRAAQTPQGFDLRSLRAADQGSNPTDEATAMERAGVEVRCVEGDALAFKVTTPADLIIAERVA